MAVTVTIITPFEETVVAERGNPDYDITSATVKTALNEVSSATLRIPFTNRRALSLTNGVLPTVAIYDSDKRVFIGSVASCKRDIFGNMEIDLDGAMSWLGNIVKPPFSVHDYDDMFAETYLDRLFTQYNMGSEAIRALYLGACTVNQKIVVSHEGEYTTMLDLLRELVELYGGYIFENMGADVGLSGDTPTVSYVPGAVGESGQVLEFGVNEISLEDYLDYSGYASRVYAVGQNGLTVTGGYKVNTYAEEIYGRKDYALKSNADTQAELDDEAQRVLSECSIPFRSIEMTALEISRINPNYNRFVIGTTVRALDRHLGEDLVLIVNSVERDLINQSNTKVVFGKAPLTFTSATRSAADAMRHALLINETAITDFTALPPVYDKTEDEIAAVAESYYTKRFFDGTSTFRFDYQTKTDRDNYGGDATYRTERFRLGMIDCSALAGLIIRGLDYDHSPYGLAYAAGGTMYQRIGSDVDGSILVAPKTQGGTLPDFDPDSVRCNPAARWAINPRDFWCLGNYKSSQDEGDDDDDDRVPSTVPAQGRPGSAANLAQLLLTMGYVVPIDGGFSQIRKGDVLFWAGKIESGEHAGEYRRPTRFLRISHVAVCCAVENGRHYYIDSVNNDNPIRKACLETDSPKAEYLILVIRLRQGKAWSRLRILSPPEDATVAAGSVQRFNCIAAGYNVRYRWQYSDDNGSTWNDSTLPHSSTVYPTISAGMDGRLYHCLCTDMHGRTATSRGAKITIGSSPGQTVTPITDTEIDSICTI